MGLGIRRNTGVEQVVAERAPLIAADPPLEDFEALYRRTLPRIYAYTASVLRDRSAAEEVTAQVYERAYRKRRSYRPRRGTVDAWLFGIARNAALDELRRRKRVSPLVCEPGAGYARTDEEAEGALRRATVRAALTTLSPRERELIALKFHAGLSNTDLGRVLGVSESNAGTLLHRAISKL
ncbi:MAG: sigma-70 family RNA polymerase sigma factor, partial [Actinobacteria bacterium]